MLLKLVDVANYLQLLSSAHIKAGDVLDSLVDPLHIAQWIITRTQPCTAHTVDQIHIKYTV